MAFLLRGNGVRFDHVVPVAVVSGPSFGSRPFAVRRLQCDAQMLENDRRGPLVALFRREALKLGEDCEPGLGGDARAVHQQQHAKLLAVREPRRLESARSQSLVVKGSQC